MKIEQISARRGIRWSLVFLGWACLGLFFTSRNIVVSLTRGQPIAWHRAILFEMLFWLVWGLLTPLIFFLAERFRIERKRWWRGALGLVLGGVVVALLQTAIDYGISLSLARYVIRVPNEEISRVLAGIKVGIIAESFTAFLTFAIIVGVYYARDYYGKYREREIRTSQLEGRLARAELQNLRMQLHPHFLFNTLHAISVLMQEDVNAANTMLVRLSDLLRMTLDNAGTHEVSLKQELEFLQGYLEIEQTRFHDRLKVRMEVEPGTLDARVPYLVLQPLVENAIRHGIARRTAAGTIEIRARRQNGMIELQVRDDGPGLDNQESVMSGVGLSNTRARHEQLYGAEHRFEISNAAGGGVLVIVVIPFRLQTDLAASGGE